MTAILEPTEATWPAPNWATQIDPNSGGGQAEIRWSRQSETAVYSAENKEPQPVEVIAWATATLWPDDGDLHLSRSPIYVGVGGEYFHLGEARKLIKALTEIVTAIDDSEAASR
jgi:hypothetical protein